MKVYKRDEDGNLLMHSDTYLGEDYISSNLFHWKYLKKVKSPSGKFRYIYDDSEMKTQEKIHNDVEKGMRSKDGYEYHDKDGKLHSYKKSGNTPDFISGPSHGIYGSGSKNYKQSASDKIKEARLDSYKKYKTQKLKDTPKRIISKGIGFINSLLLNIEKKFIK